MAASIRTTTILSLGISLGMIAFAATSASAQSPCAGGPQVMYTCDDGPSLHRWEGYGTAAPVRTTIGVLPGFGMFDIAVHPVTGQMYGCTVSALYKIDKTNASAVLVGNFGSLDMRALDFTGSGVLYARSRLTGGLYTLSLTTGAATLVGVPEAIGDGDLACVGDGFAYGVDASNNLVRIDLATATSTLVGPMATNGIVWGLDVDCDGTLYASTGFNRWHAIDPATGAVLSTVHLTGLFGNIQGIAFDRSMGARGPYCTAGTTTNGCVPLLDASGEANTTSTGMFLLTLSGADGTRSGLFFYGSGEQATPWGSGGTSWLCVSSPTQRTWLQTTTGTSGSCDGTMILDWNAYMAAQPTAFGHPLFVGQGFDAQAWMRDPPATKTSGLSNGYHFELVP